MTVRDSCTLTYDGKMLTGEAGQPLVDFLAEYGIAGDSRAAPRARASRYSRRYAPPSRRNTDARCFSARHAKLWRAPPMVAVPSISRGQASLAGHSPIRTR